MLVPFAFLAGVLTLVTAPGLIAQSLKERREKMTDIEGQS